MVIAHVNAIRLQQSKTFKQHIILKYTTRLSPFTVRRNITACLWNQYKMIVSLCV